MNKTMTLEEYRKKCLKNKYSKASFEKNKERWEENTKKTYERYKKIQEGVVWTEEFLKKNNTNLQTKLKDRLKK